MAMKSLLIFALCFLVGAAGAIGVRAAFHRPYAEATEAHDMAAPPGSPASPAPPSGTGHEGHGMPNGQTPEQVAPVLLPKPEESKPEESKPDAKPAGANEHQNHGSAPAKVGDPSVAIGNTICPACGMEVDTGLAAIPTTHGLVGIACPPCVPKITREPDRYGAAALENRKAP